MSKPPSPFNLETHEALQDILKGTPDTATLNNALRHLAKWRVKLLENTTKGQSGATVQSGPFAGMLYDTQASEGAMVPRLLGTYEATLAPIIADIIANAPSLIIDIGSAEGYYAVGLARALPDAIIWARDANEIAQETCAALADRNGVSARVKTGGALTHADFDICRAQNTVVICDIEGGEDALLDPDHAKGLRRADILVEVHEGSAPGLTQRMIDRFNDTHDIKQIDRHFDSNTLPDWMHALSDLDRHLALWEWRSAPTPWLWMQRKHR